MHRFDSEAERLTWELTARPGWLPSPSGPLLAWYHPPRDRARGPAVLLCDTVGSDRMNLHLAYRHLALQLAWAGYPALRIDYPGTGDSAGSPRQPDRLAVWLDALGRGAERLKAASGATEIVAFGALFGGTLAALLAARRSDVSGLVAWGAYPRGSEFLRHARAMERISGSNPEGRRPPGWEEGDMESLGFLFRAATVADINQLDLAQLEFPHLRHACLMPWDEPRGPRPFHETLARNGVEVTDHPQPLSSGEDSLRHQAVPAGVVTATLEWLDGLPTAAPTAAPAEPPADELTARIADPAEGPAVREQCAWMGADHDVFGIVSEPDGAAPGAQPQAAASVSDKLAVVLVNGGNNHRPGINRNYTEWARRWAGQGVTVVRMDIRGLGDSPPRRAGDLNILYRPETADDVIAVMDWLAHHRGVTRFVLGGLCAGAFQALHAARQDQRVVGLWLLELLRFYHDERSWRTRVARSMRRAVRWAGAPAPLRRLLDTPLGRWLRALCGGRQVRVLAVYRANETMLGEFREELMQAHQSLVGSGCYELRLMNDTNHIFSPLWSQAELGAVLETHLHGLLGERQHQGDGVSAQ